MASTAFSARLTKASEADVDRYLNELLKGSRREAKAIVKNLARKASNSAAKMTIPNTGRNMPQSGTKSSVRRPKLADKFRPVINAKDKFTGGFYMLTSSTVRKSKRKQKKRSRNGFSMRGAVQGENRVMRGSKGEMVFYTKKAISQKDGRFKKVTKVIEIWDKKKKQVRYVPTLTRGKYEKDGKVGRIPHYFTAKQAWLYSAARLNTTRTTVLNPGARNYGRLTDKLQNEDSPSVTLTNNSNYVLKSGGRTVPRRAVVKALRGFGKELEKRKQAIIDKARK